MANLMAIEELFYAAGRISKGTFNGLRNNVLGHSIFDGIKEHFSRHEFTAEEKDVIKETVQYIVRFASSYVDHHDENTRYRICHPSDSIQDELINHWNEIYDAAYAAAESRIKSKGYDRAVGSPSSVLGTEQFVKQMVIAGMNEAAHQLNQHS